MTEAASQLRAFIAVPLPPALQQRIDALQQQLHPLIPGVRWAKTENLHLTLHFLGDQDKELLAEIGRNMISIGRKKKNFNVAAKGLGFFPGRRRPRVLWLGLAPAKQIVDLHRQLAAALQQLGVKTGQNTYRPHLTIGRFRQPPEDLESLCPFLSHDCGNFTIDRMILYSSSLTPQGAIHSPLQTALLSA